MGRKLELGSGFSPTEGFEHADLNSAAPSLDHLLDFSQPLPFDDAIFDELRAVDVAEHCSWRAVPAIFAEWARILKPGGLLFVQVPSAGTIMRWYVADDERLRRWEHGQRCTALYGAQWRLYGGLDDGHYVEDGGDPRLNVHMAMFDEESIWDLLNAAGFAIESLVENAHPNIQIYARRL